MSNEYVAAEPFLSFQCNNLLNIFSDYSLFSLSNAFNLASTISNAIFISRLQSSEKLQKFRNYSCHFAGSTQFYFIEAGGRMMGLGGGD